MRLKMLISTEDCVYAELVADYISEHYSNSIETSVCSTFQHFEDMLATKRYDVALMDSAFMEQESQGRIQLPILLVGDDDFPNASGSVVTITKHQRISSIVSGVLECFSKVSKSKGVCTSRANVTVTWSPAGGVGKTTTSLAFASSLVADAKKVFYLNLEEFSSVPAYFSEKGKSISDVFEMLDNSEGDVKMLISGICAEENGIAYLNSPNNYVDMQALSVENIADLISACSSLTDELVIDLPCECNEKTRYIMEAADNILIVTDKTESAKAKLAQFLQQNNVFEHVKEKCKLVLNKDALDDERISSQFISAPILFPLIRSENEASVYQEIAEHIRLVVI